MERGLTRWAESAVRNHSLDVFGRGAAVTGTVVRPSVRLATSSPHAEKAWNR